MLECLAVRAAQDRMEMRYMVHSIYLLYSQGPTDVTTPRKRTRKQTRQSLFLVNSVVIEALYLLASIDSCVHPY